MNKEEIKSKLNKNMALLEKKYHIKKMGLFGSVARGEQEEKSDIDILVEFSAPIGLFDFIRLENFLSEMLGGKVDLVSKKSVKPMLEKYISRDLIYV